MVYKNSKYLLIKQINRFHFSSQRKFILMICSFCKKCRFSDKTVAKIVKNPNYSFCNAKIDFISVLMYSNLAIEMQKVNLNKQN